MVVSFVPGVGGMLKNFKLIGNGSVFDSNKKIFQQNNFDSAGLLSGENCLTVNYAADPVFIRVGNYVAGVENGTISEYVFPQSSWSKFLSGTDDGVTSTKYTQVFSNGVWQSTSATATINITSTNTRDANNNISSFSFVEL
jgi:hypothetical protein